MDAAARPAVAVLAVIAACASCSIVTTSPGPVAQTPVPRQVLAPEKDPPVVDLCLVPLTTTADGRARPLLCRSGAVNVLAWRFYAPTSDTLFRKPAAADQALAEAAVCDDLDHNHATRPQEADAFVLASAYHGWTFLVDTARDPCI